MLTRFKPHEAARLDGKLLFSHVLQIMIDALFRSFRNPIFSLEHIFDVSLQNQQIRSDLAINLQRPAIIPLDRAFNFFAIL